ILVGPPSDIMEAVRGSTLKLDDLEAVVIDGASSIAALGGWGEVDALLDLVPRTSQRVVISAGYPAEIEDLIERRVKKAIRYPAEPAIPEDEPVLPISGTIGYVVVAGAQKLDLLGRQLSERNDRPPPILFFGLDERAAVVAEQLSVRG